MKRFYRVYHMSNCARDTWWNLKCIGVQAIVERRAKSDVKVCTQNNALPTKAQEWIPEKGDVLED